jgi:uncharacterized protein
MSVNAPRPYLTVLAKPTGRCNLKCVFCYQDMNEMLRGPRMSEDVQETLVRRTCEYPALTLNLQWIGGESLAAGIDFYKRCEELVTKYQRPGTRVHCPVQTNGTLLNMQWVEFLRKNPRYPLSISFEVYPHLQNTLRAGRGAFADSYTKVANNLRMLKQEGIPYGILSVIELATLDVRPREWIETAVDVGIRQIGLQLSYAQIYTGDLSKVQRYINWLDELFIEQADYNSSCDPSKRLKIRETYYLYNLIRQTEVRYGCCHHAPDVCSNFLVSVDDKGKVYGHCDAFMGTEDEDGESYCIGSIMEDSFMSIMASPKMTEIKNSLVAGRAKCEECSYFELCRGGCGFFKKMSAGSISAGFGDPIESYCAIKIALLSYVTDPERAKIILRSYPDLHLKNKLPGYNFDTTTLYNIQAAGLQQTECGAFTGL